MMRMAFPALILFLVGGCENQPSQPTQPGRSNETETTIPSGPNADINASLETVAEAPSHSVPARRFVGRWAASARLCSTAAWRFTDDALETPAGSACRFTEVREVLGGYDIAARCTAEAPERDDVLKLRFPESAGGMLFESESIADAGLIRCAD